MTDETPKPGINIKPSASTVNGLTIGIPAGIIVVWVTKTFLIPTGTELPVEVASAIGSLVAQFAGLFFSGGRASDTE